MCILGDSGGGDLAVRLVVGWYDVLTPDRKGEFYMVFFGVLELSSLPQSKRLHQLTAL
jgi:hypothetical protein